MRQMGQGPDRETGPSMALQPSVTAMERRTPRRFTRGLKLAANGAMTASGALVLPPILFMIALGSYGLVQAAAVLLVFFIWFLSALENGSLWANQRLREAAYEEMKDRRPDLARSAIGFVGVCTPHYLYHQLWHSDMAHEDVGLLCTSSAGLTFCGDGSEIRVARDAIADISMRTNLVYGMFGIRWIRITYCAPDNSSDFTYLYLQSREKDRLSQMPACNRALLNRLQSWWGRTQG